MARADLLALGPESLAALANLGLVKRAQRELAAGQGPSLEELGDGTVVGTFEGGVVARLPPGQALKDAPCTCGAVGTCRHRVATALAYRAWHEERLTASRRAPAAASPWSPAELGDDALERACGKKTLERARAALGAGLVVGLTPWSEDDPVPTARLPATTVRFLVPRDVAYARCDCAAQTACEHVVLAVWAFREAGSLDAPRTMSLGGARGAGDAARAALSEARALVDDVLRTGVATSTAGLGSRFARVRASLDEARVLWPSAAMDDVERQLEAYAARSSRHRASDLAEALASVEARRRAADADGAELPPRFVLGQDDAKETLLDHVRLVSLGARVSGDGPHRDVEIFLADPDGAVVLVLAKRFPGEEGKPPEDGPALARRNVAARIPLGTLARGQLVSRAVKRHANRAMTLAATRTVQSSVTPQRGEWGSLPSPLLVRDLAALDEHRRAQPPRLLRPRVLCDAMHVVAVTKVRDVGYVPAEQELWAHVEDDAGAVLRLAKRHKAVAPHALGAMEAALAKGVRFVSGEIGVGAGHELEMDPVALVTEDGVVVPDLEPTGGDLSGVARFAKRAQPEPHAEALLAAQALLEEALHHGLARPPRTFGERSAAAATRARALGLEGLAARLERLYGAPKEAAPAAWLELGIHVELLRDLV